MKQKRINRNAILDFMVSLLGVDHMQEFDSNRYLIHKDGKVVGNVCFLSAVKEFMYTISILMVETPISEANHNAIAEYVTKLETHRNIMVSSDLYNTMA